MRCPVHIRTSRCVKSSRCSRSPQSPRRSSPRQATPCRRDAARVCPATGPPRSVVLCLVFVVTPNAAALGPKSVNYLLTLAPAAGAGLALLAARSGVGSSWSRFGVATIAAVNIAGVVQGRAEVTGVTALRSTSANRCATARTGGRDTRLRRLLGRAEPQLADRHALARCTGRRTAARSSALTTSSQSARGTSRKAARRFCSSTPRFHAYPCASVCCRDARRHIVSDR